MKQIFDWLREQIGTKKGDAETRMWRLIDEDRGDRCVYSATDIEEFSANTLADVLSILDEAETKWEEDCCEWKHREHYVNCFCKCYGIMVEHDWAIGFKFCPYCGKPIKISEVE